MRFSFTTLAVMALASQTVVGDSWFTGNTGKLAYNKWHETELERWLSDHNIPYPAPADRKDLQDLVQKNWDNNVAKPYNSWDTNQLSNYLTSQGHEIKKGTEKNKDSLLSQVQSYWKGTADSTHDAYSNVQTWIFDSWTESQLKSFLDYHGIPNPTPRTRDSLLQTARSNYQSAATKAGETASYPGNWLYSSWSESDLKAWLDEHGVPVPQPDNRDKLIASIRRNSYTASHGAAAKVSSLSASAAGAQQSLTNALLDSWSDSQIKEWCDKAGIKVPQGSKRNELIALARKHSSGNVASSASSAFNAATTSAGNTYAQASGDAYAGARYYYDLVMNNLGFASADAKASLSSASSVASSSLSSASSVASASSSSLASAASSSASSASKQASKSGQNTNNAMKSASSEASASAKSAASQASASAASAKSEL